VDEINGQYSVIQSDDPDATNKTTTWTVSNMLISTVSEFLEEHQVPIPRLETVRKETLTAVEPKLSERELFLSCLRKEIATREPPHSQVTE
jgi:hypothetical protein